MTEPLERRVGESELTIRIGEIERRMNLNAENIESIKINLKNNTTATDEVLEIIRMGKSFFKFAGIIGAFLKWAVAIAAGVGAAYVAWKTK